MRDDLECDFTSRRFRVQRDELQRQTFGQVTCAHARFVERLHELQSDIQLILGQGRLYIHELRQFLQILPQIAVVIERFDDELRHCPVAIVDWIEPQRVVQRFMQRGFNANPVGRVGAFAIAVITRRCPAERIG
jgi:hypothetical protein